MESKPSNAVSAQFLSAGNIVRACVRKFILLLTAGMSVGHAASIPPGGLGSPTTMPVKHYCQNDLRSKLTALPNDEGYLAAGIRNLTRESVKALGLSSSSAILMVQIAADGPADKAGVKPGDVILAVNGRDNLNVNSFIEVIRKTIPGNTVRLDVLRKGETKTLTATVAGTIGASKVELKGTSPERSFAAEEAIEENFPRERFPLEWAISRYYAGRAALLFVNGTVAEDTEKAIEAYEAALSVPEFRTSDQDWALAQELLGDAYRKRQTGDYSENIERAIKAFQAALTVRNPSAAKYWAQDQYFLAETFRIRQVGEPADNIEASIIAYQAALAVISARDRWWAGIQGRLGIAYAERVKGNLADNVEFSIKAYEAALPAQMERNAWWAELQRRLGIAYEMRAAGKMRGNLLLAARAYEAALTVFTASAFPAEHAEVEQLKNGALSKLSSLSP